MTVGWWGRSRTSRSISWARRLTPARRKDSPGSLSARAAGDDDFQRHVQFSAIPESFQRRKNFRDGRGLFLRRELRKQRPEGCGHLAELFPVFFRGSGPMSVHDSSFFMDVGETGGLEGAAKAAALATHEHTRAIRIGRRRRHGNVFEQDPRSGGEERLLFLSPGDKRGATAGC